MTLGTVHAVEEGLTQGTHSGFESANKLGWVSVVLCAGRDKLTRQSEGCTREEFCSRAGKVLLDGRTNTK